MDKIASFTVNHLDLIPGVYVSRKDYVGKEVLTTFDLRMTSPNREPVMNTAELHTIEHLAATYLRNNDEWKEKVIYFDQWAAVLMLFNSCRRLRIQRCRRTCTRHFFIYR